MLKRITRALTWLSQFFFAPSPPPARDTLPSPDPTPARVVLVPPSGGGQEPLRVTTSGPPATFSVALPASAFGRLTESALWSPGTPVETRVVWLTLLTLADGDGVGRETLDQVAECAGLTRVDVARALEHLVAVKRLEATGDGRWRILNHRRYQVPSEQTAS